jgi:chromosome partitioning protein
MNPPLVIACAGRKGGSGKTTAALGLAAWYSRHGANVLLVDLDPQGSATLALGADGAGAGLRRLLEGNAEKVQFCTIFENLALLPGGPELARMENPRPIRQALDGAALDVVLVDCPPGHAELDALALEAADVVLACCEAHRMGIAGAARILDEARNMDPPPACALLLARMDERRGLDRAAADLLAGAFRLPVYPIHQDARLAAAMNAGGLPPHDGRAAADVEALARWIDKQARRGDA